MRVLNLYSGIGGNRKLWGSDINVTAIEIDTKIAEIYQDLYPNDTVIIADAHDYLLLNYHSFDFIWSSPPCQSHSVTNHFLNAQGVRRYPNMMLYEEIILLQTFFKGKYCVENVKSYYPPLIKPQVSGRHYFWANFKIPKMKVDKQIGRMNGTKSSLGNTQAKVRSKNHEQLGFNLDKFNITNSKKEKVLNNCVSPLIGKAIFDSALNIYNDNNIKNIGLFG